MTSPGCWAVMRRALRRGSRAGPGVRWASRVPPARSFPVASAGVAGRTDRKDAPKCVIISACKGRPRRAAADAAPPAASTDLGWSWFDTAIVVAVAVATVLVHPVHLMLSHPYWLDEAWVAVLTKAPLRRVAAHELERAGRVRRAPAARARVRTATRPARGARLLGADGRSPRTCSRARLAWKQRWMARFGGDGRGARR